MGAQRPNSTGTLLTLERGIRVLEEISRANGLITARSIGSSLGINQGTIYQILRTLQDCGYVQRLQGGRYQLGARIAYLVDGYQAHAAPPQAVMDQLSILHQLTDETVYAVLVLGSSLAVVGSFESNKRVRVSSLEVGSLEHPHALAAGKALLAFSEPTEMVGYFDDRRLPALTGRTLTDWDSLLGELARIRSAGVAFEHDEHEDGVSGAGTVILGSHGEPVGAFGTAVPSSRLDDVTDVLVAALLKAGEEASRALRYRGEYPPHQPQSRHPKRPFVSR